MGQPSCKKSLRGPGSLPPVALPPPHVHHQSWPAAYLTHPQLSGREREEVQEKTFPFNLVTWK